MNRKIFVSLFSIAVMAVMVGAVTYAYFSDNGTSSGNVFATGTLNLQLDDSDEGTPTPVENVSASFNGTQMAPGTSTTGFISLHNGGSIDFAEILLGADQTANNSGDSNLADVLNLTVLTGDDSSCASSQMNHTITIDDQIGGGNLPLTLTELNNTNYDSLPGLNAGLTKYLCVTFTMDTGASNAYQGDSITESFIFDAHQNVSQ